MALPGTLATIVGGICLVLGVSAVAHDLSQPLSDQAHARLDVGWMDSLSPGPAPDPAHAGVGTVLLGDGALLGLSSCASSQVSVIPALTVESAVRELADRGVPRRLVVHIGTSQGLTERDARDLIAVLGTQTLVVWSTIQLPDDSRRFAYETETNRVVRSLASEFGHVRLLDWNQLTAQRADLLLEDGFHPSPRGCRVYERAASRLLGEARAESSAA